VARHQRVEDLLLAMRGYLRSCHIKVVLDEQAPALRSSRFRSLPPNITFTPQSLHVEFFGTEDFLAARSVPLSMRSKTTTMPSLSLLRKADCP